MVAAIGEGVLTDKMTPIQASEAEKSLIADVARFIGDERARVLRLTAPDGKEVTVPPSVYEVLQRSVQTLAQGGAVAVASVAKLLTTNEAAELLNVSRPYLVQLLEHGDIPFTKVGTHRRVALGDLLAYKARRDAKRHAALMKLAQLSEEYGLYDRT